MKKFLYLPIESKVREFDAKVLIALEAVKNDYIVIIGSKSMIRYMKFLPKGIFIYKDSSSIMEEKFRKIRSYGHKVVVHDEEGFVQMNWDDYRKTRIDFDTLKYIDKYLCWGNEQFKAIEKSKNSINKNLNIVKVGHPRIDLLKNPIRNYNFNKSNNSKVILVNTKLAEYNHRQGENAWIDIMKNHKMLQDESFIKLKMDQVSYKKSLMECYINLINSISGKYKDCKIILRPHPVENIDKWKELTNNLENVTVTNEKPIGYWIHQSDVVIHTGCTTALEAFIMDKPVITFKPIDDKRFEVPLPDSISLKATNEDQCVELIGRLIDNDYNYDAYKKNGNEILSKNIESLEGEFAYQKIVKELNKLEVQPVNFSFILQIKIKSLFLIQKIKSYAKKYLKPTALNENQVFHKNDIELSVQSLQKVIDMQDDIIIDKLSENLYMLWKNND
ncbi:MAG: surface carbohydrate biosynthesis protein [Arcobacter sp.]